MRLIVGLGNPESKYEYTRHNLGFLVLAALAAKYGVKYKKSTLAQALETNITIDRVDCFLMMPLTFMNHSGVAVKQWVDKKALNVNDLLIVCDDLALSFGQMRLRLEGSAGGHNGLKSVIEHLGSQHFARLRLGIGWPHPDVDAVDYVLSNFTPGEKKFLSDFINRAQDCVISWVTKDTEVTRNQFNHKRNIHEQV